MQARKIDAAVHLKSQHKTFLFHGETLTVYKHLETGQVVLEGIDRPLNEYFKGMPQQPDSVCETRLGKVKFVKVQSQFCNIYS